MVRLTGRLNMTIAVDWDVKYAEYQSLSMHVQLYSGTRLGKFTLSLFVSPAKHVFIGGVIRLVTLGFRSITFKGKHNFHSNFTEG